MRKYLLGGEMQINYKDVSMANNFKLKKSNYSVVEFAKCCEICLLVKYFLLEILSHLRSPNIIIRYQLLKYISGWYRPYIGVTLFISQQ